eukprot:1500487-Rhodomonas_salina.4
MLPDNASKYALFVAEDKQSGTSQLPPCYGFATRCPLYDAMCGTEIGYAATRKDGRDGRAWDSSVPRYAMPGTAILYAPTPVLRQRMGLPVPIYRRPGIRLRASYAVSGTEIAYAFIPAARCPVVTYCMLLRARYAQSGTNMPRLLCDIRYKDSVWCYLPTTRRVVLCVYALAMSGTNAAYAPTHILRARDVPRLYVHPMRYPVPN